MSLQISEEVTSNTSFKPPLDKPFNPYISYAVGWDVYQEVQTWTLKCDKGHVTLSNEIGAHYDIGETTKPLKRCSLAFLQFKTPYMTLEFEDEVRLYSFDLNTREWAFKFTMNGYRDVALLYQRSLHRDALMFAGVKIDNPTQAVMGYIDLLTHKLKVEDTTNGMNEVQLKRFGMSSDNRLQLELVQN